MPCRHTSFECSADANQIQLFHFHFFGVFQLLLKTSLQIFLNVVKCNLAVQVFPKLECFNDYALRYSARKSENAEVCHKFKTDYRKCREISTFSHIISSGFVYLTIRLLEKIRKLYFWGSLHFTWNPEKSTLSKTCLTTMQYASLRSLKNSTNKDFLFHLTRLQIAKDLEICVFSWTVSMSFFSLPLCLVKKTFQERCQNENAITFFPSIQAISFLSL